MAEQQTVFTCKQHGDYQAEYKQVGKRQIKPRCPQCLAEIADREKARKMIAEARERADRMRRLLKASGISSLYEGRSFDNFNVENPGQKKALTLAKMYADHFESRVMAYGTCLVFVGGCGTGKTHLASAIGNQVIDAGHTALYLELWEALGIIKDSYHQPTERSEREVIYGFALPDLLIIDEVGDETDTPLTDWEAKMLFNIINVRRKTCKPTIAISNRNQDGFVKLVGDRCMSRLREGGGVTVPFFWNDYRPRVHLDVNLPGASTSNVDWLKGA